MSGLYKRPLPLDPTALRESTARYKAHNDRLAASFARESASGMLARLEAEDRAATERRAKLACLRCGRALTVSVSPNGLVRRSECSGCGFVSYNVVHP